MTAIHYIQNIPFFSIFLAMFGGIVTPLFGNGKTAQKVNLIIVTLIGILSAMLLAYLWQKQESLRNSHM